MNTGYLLKQLLGTCVFFLVIFISAGRIAYWQGLIYVAIGLCMFLLQNTLLKMDAALIQERSKPGEGAKKWDKTILGLSFLATLLMFVTAGLDSGRYNWSPAFPTWVTITGIILTAAGQLLFLVAQKQNRFFSSTVRVQTERGHVVCDTGLYAVVRHPAYLGSVIQVLGFPLLFGSVWSIIPVTISIFLIVIRTRLEDRTLMHELNGYTGYCHNTPFKLLPFVW